MIENEDSKLSEALKTSPSDMEGSPDFDLDKLMDCSFSYNFDPLKKALSYLLKNQAAQPQSSQESGPSPDMLKLQEELKECKEIIQEMKDEKEEYMEQLRDHETRLKKIENEDPDNVQGKINELHYEIKLLSDRIKDVQLRINDLANKFKAIDPNEEELSGDAKEVEAERKQLEAELNALKGRVNQTEDKLKMVIMKLKFLQSEGEGEDDGKTEGMQENLKKLKEKIKDLEQELSKYKLRRPIPTGPGVDASEIIEALRNDFETDIGLLRDKVYKIESDQEKTEFRSNNNEARIDELEKDTKAHRERLSILMKEMKEQKANHDTIDKKLMDFKALLNGKVDNDTFEREISYLKDLLNNIAKNKNAKFEIPSRPISPALSQEQMDKLDKLENIDELEAMVKILDGRVGIIENRQDATDKDKEELMRLINEKAPMSVKDDISSLKEAVDEIHRECEQFNQLKGEIEQVNKRCESLDRTLTSLEERLDMIKESINGCLRDIENLLKTLKEDFEKLEREANRQGGVIIKINQRIDTLEIKIDNLDKTFAGGLLDVGGLGESSKELDVLREDIDSLKRAFVSFKEDYYKRVKEIDEELEKKVDKSDLIEFERLMRERMEANEKAQNKMKNDLRKAIRILDDRVKKLSDQTNSRGPSLDREDALLAKRPLEGWKCATCDKDLVNMSGLPADHHNWNRMPRKEGERIPMMGQGFSRMLMTMNQNASSPNLSKMNSRTLYSPRRDEMDGSVLEDTPGSSRNEKIRSSLGNMEKDGSTTIGNSILPQIKKKSKSILK